MTFQFFNPSSMNQLGKFQGTLSGTFAAQSPYIGVAQGPTSIYNQAGYYAIQDPATGYVSLKKLADNSIYTNKWYDQSTDTTFNFKESKTTFEESDLSDHMTAEEIANLVK